MAYFIFIIVLAFWLAKLEIQIEGPDGWAKNLPTWRIEKHWLLDLFWGGRAMTGYHFWIMTFMLLLFHAPIFFVQDWSWQLEFRTIGGFILLWIVEDFLWFVVNPTFGIRKFKKIHIHWHPRWFLGLPIEYWMFTPIASGLIYISY
jgi:hypothetical protein